MNSVKKFRIPSKLKRTKKAKPTVDKDAASGRVTSDNVSEHRDAVLGKARRFKYPFARSKHRVALTSIAMVILALLILGTFTGLRLYRWQDTNDFTYRTTQLLPFPVAKVDGSYVSYESYLFELRSSVHWQEKYGTTDLRSPDGRRQIDYLKRSALEKAHTNTIAHTLASKNDVKVSDKEVDSVVGRIKASGGNLEQILGESFNFTEGELRRYISDNILRRKVAKKLDTQAPQKAAQVLQQVRSGKPFADAAKESSDDLETKSLGGDIGVVEKGRANVPEEVAEKIFQMKAGEVSDVIATPSDYFIVQATEKVDENRVRLSIIRIKVKDMTQYLQEYRDQKKVNEYIKLPEISAQLQ